MGRFTRKKEFFTKYLQHLVPKDSSKDYAAHLIKKQTISCALCDKVFSSQFSFNRHSKSIHQLINGPQKECRLMCPYVDCDNKLSHFKSLRGHLLVEHDVQIHLEVVEFSSLEDFNKWKCQIELETLARYTLDTSPKKLTNKIEKRYYGCHRSYSYRPRGNGLRSLKNVGSSKIGKACPARMEVTITKSEDKNVCIKVNFFKTHLGHSLELDHVTLDKESRKEIKNMMKDGYTFDQILKCVKESPIIQTGINKRLSLICRKDLHNLARTIKNETEPDEISDNERYEFKIEDCNQQDFEWEHEKDVFYNEEKEENRELVNITQNQDEKSKIIVVEEESQEEKELRNNTKIIKQTSLIINICSNTEVSSDKCDLILKHLDEVINILNDKDEEEI